MDNLDFTLPPHLAGPTPLAQVLGRLDEVARLLQLVLQEQQRQTQALQALASRQEPPPTP